MPIKNPYKPDSIAATQFDCYVGWYRDKPVHEIVRRANELRNNAAHGCTNGKFGWKIKMQMEFQAECAEMIADYKARGKQPALPHKLNNTLPEWKLPPA